MFHFNSCEMMQENAFDDYCIAQPVPDSKNKANNFQDLLESKMCNNAEEFNACRFMNTQRVLDDVIQQDYSPNHNYSFMLPLDSFQNGPFMPPEPNFVDAILQETFDVDLFCPGMNQDCRYQTAPSVSDVNFTVTADLLKSKFDVDQASQQYLDESYYFCEDNPNCWGTVAAASNLPEDLPKSLSTDDINYIQEILEDKKLVLLLLSTLLNKEDVLERCKGALKEIHDGTAHQFSQSQCGFTSKQMKPSYSCAKAKDYKPPKYSGLKRVHENEKDEKYWKRRKENNAAVRRSREAKRDRFAVMEKQIKELEVENAEKKIYLRTLKKKVLEQEKKFMECEIPR